MRAGSRTLEMFSPGLAEVEGDYPVAIPPAAACGSIRLKRPSGAVADVELERGGAGQSDGG